MKFTCSLLVSSLLFLSCNHKAGTMDNKNFTAEKVSKTATIMVNDSISAVFPLFGAFEERKWAEGWNPTLVYPATEIMEEGTTFKTKGHGHGHDEGEFIWRVSKYESENFVIQYMVTSENRYWTITIQCGSAPNNKTSATITYTFIGLNELGNRLNKHAIENMYSHNLEDWQEAMNNYLAKRN